MLRLRKSQSILEYTIILAAIVAGIIFAATKLVRPAVEKGMTDATSVIETSTGDFRSQINP